MQYKELHVYDFDDTLYKSPSPYPDGVNTKYLQFILASVKSFVKNNADRFINIDYNKFSLNEKTIYDVDFGERYELLYNNKPITSAIYDALNRKMRDKIEIGMKVGRDAKKDSYYIKTDVGWYETSASLQNYDGCIIKTTNDDFMKSMSHVEVYTVVLTGRNQRLTKYVKNILDTHGLHPDELILSPGGVSTRRFKIDEIKRILKEHQSITKIIMWEDRPTYEQSYKDKLSELGIEFEIKMVKKHYIQEYVSRFLNVLTHINRL